MKHFKLKDPGSAITHFIGMLMAMFAATPLILRAMRAPDTVHVISLSIFIVSMILLYAASTTYHTFDLSERTNKILKKLDHCMIFVLIAGSYTPICLIVLHGRTGLMLLALVWSIAILGIIFKLCWVTCPKWVSSVLYIAMGWVCVLAFTQILNSLPAAAFNWLLAGGIIYTFFENSHNFRISFFLFYSAVYLNFISALNLYMSVYNIPCSILVICRSIVRQIQCTVSDIPPAIII